MDIKSLDDFGDRNILLSAINTALDVLSDPRNMLDPRASHMRQRLTAMKMELAEIQDKVIAGVG